MAAAAVIVLLPGTALADHETLLVSRLDGLNGLGADSTSFDPSISADGRFVAFTSTADNLSSADNNNFRNIFVRDAMTGTTTLVSRASGAGGIGADGDATGPSITADGRYVAFESGADNLSTADNNSFTNIFVRDLQANTTTLASVGFDGAGANDNSFAPSIAPLDGRLVAFQSGADNLSTGDNNSFTNVFVRELGRNTNTLASITFDNAAGGNGHSVTPSLSGGGGQVAFASDADNLSTGDNNSFRNIFVRDLRRNETTLASRNQSAGADGHSYNPTLGGGTGTTPPGTRCGAAPGCVAFESLADNLSQSDNNSVQNIFVREFSRESTRLVSSGNDSSARPSISSDGRFIAFDSRADNLTFDGNDNFNNVFVVDLEILDEKLISRASGATGVAANDSSFRPSISADGSFVAFDSQADNLSAEDFDFATNVFRRHHLTRTLLPGRCANKLRGTNAGERLTGTLRGDRISGRGGNDVLAGLDGDDCLAGGRGRDRLSGGKGKDRLSGGSGRDRLSGGSGRDRLSGGSGRDRLNGGSGRDRIRGGRGRDRVRGGSGRDRINVRGGGKDRVNCGKGRDRVNADASDVVGSNCEVVEVG